MDGDCQVMNGAVSPDSLFSSPIRNPNPDDSQDPNLGFITGMPSFNPFIKEEGGMGLMMVVGRSTAAMSKEEEVESGGSGSGHVDGMMSCGEDEYDKIAENHHLDGGAGYEKLTAEKTASEATTKRKRFHRHTAHQIQEMEALFKECPHPDDKQRQKLSQELGLKPRQIKFWFQNRRTQMKAQQDRADNAILRAENESLKNDNFRLQAAIRNVICPNCGGPAIIGEMPYDEQHLRIENACLKDELERLSCLAARYASRPMQSLGPTPPLLLPSLDLDMNIYSRHFTDIIPAPPLATDASLQAQFNGVMIMDQDKGLALDLAVTASEQLTMLCTMNEPLWVKSGGGMVVEVLDMEEYGRLFQWPVEFKRDAETRVEATRDSGIAMMNGITLVDAFLDANKWMELFPTIVSKAKTLQILTAGISGHGNGSLHLMYAEFMVLSPLVPTREAYFLRYCQQDAEEGTWTIVDFPIDAFHDGLQVPFPRYRRRPSGCIIQDMPNGYAKVMWVEHGGVEDKPLHQMFNQLVGSGVAFGATRWISILQRQCERHASYMARNISDLGVIPSLEARKNMMKLSQRMVKTFCANISSSHDQTWAMLPESSDDTVRITTRKNTEPGQPNAVILGAASTTWLPFSHRQVFDLLTDEQRRSQIDVLSNGNSLHEISHIANGSHPRNCVSLLRINASSNSSHSVELLVQESSTHQIGGSIVVYAMVDVDAVQVVMSGEDPSYISLLPTGFVLLPAPSPVNPSADSGTDADRSAGSTGCLLTIGTQAVAGAVPLPKLSHSVNDQLSSAVHQITAALSGGNDSGGSGNAAAADP